jgi:Protein of unknown function (DUF3467)
MEVPSGQPAHQGSGGNGRRMPEIKLRMPEAVSGGVYANTMLIQHTPQEFVLDFALVTGGNGQIVARVITSPTHMKQMLKAMEENVHKYEAVYGPIVPPQASV